MVFAKSPKAASYLCHAWREKSDNASQGATLPVVEKVYLAVVREWPPFQRNREVSGIIDLPLEPCGTERLKWQVADVASPTAKSSQTQWRVVSSSYRLPSWCEALFGSRGKWHTSSNQDSKRRTKMNGIVLELRPITGRTHQLRLHCAHVGSGIIGDSLYGKDRLCDIRTYDPNDATRNHENGPHLMLHAAVLTFPRPPTHDDTCPAASMSCTVTAWPSWYDPCL
jgi:tRNA pseudouridine32 synthase / 23S rRNA pseudouridine746 synthase